LKDITELTQILAQYFFIIESKENLEPKITKSVKESGKKEEIKETSKLTSLLVGKKYCVQAQILSKQKTCLADIWKIFYLDQQKRKRYFLVNDYQKPNVLGDLGAGSAKSILLVQGNKHIFFARILTI